MAGDRLVCGLWVGMGGERATKKNLFGCLFKRNPFDIGYLSAWLAVVVLAWCLFLRQMRMRLARFLCTHYTASGQIVQEIYIQQ